LKADAQGIYWIGGDTGLQVLRSGAVSPQLLAFVGSQRFAIDDGALYFATNVDASRLDLKKIKRDGTGLTLVASGVHPGTSIALGADGVYFNPDPNSLASAPQAGGGPVQTVVAGPTVYNVVADATHVYWLQSSSEASTVDTSEIWRAPHGSTAIERVADGLKIRTLWEQGDGLIFLSDELGPVGERIALYLLEVPKAGGCPRVLVSLPPSRYPYRITAVAIDDQGIYWTTEEIDTARYAVWYAPRTGGIAVKVSTALYDENLALTPTRVFWVDRIPLLWTFASQIQVMDRP
jgi:hypothetical protein